MKVLHIAAEAFPLIKTGGLADVAAALPAAQRGLGADARLLLPGYPGVLAALAAAGTLHKPVIDVGPVMGAARVRLLSATMPGADLPLLILDAPWYFERDGNPYLGADGQAWPDNHRRFGLLGWIGAQVAAGALIPAWRPDVVHAHDWHAALALAYLAQQPAANTRRVFTIHNLAFQGRFALDAAPELQLPVGWLTPERLEFHGELSFMKAGIIGAHRITTVSPTYAREILQPEFGEGLDGLLRKHEASLVGILNGIDDALWNPEIDPELAHNYSLDRWAGKQENRLALQRELGLSEQGGMIIALVSRLSEQKGVDSVLAALPQLLAADCQLVVLGSGDASLERALRAAAAADPGHVSVTTRFDESLAHRIFGAADAILVPSRFEPCGLTQMYGLRYGTVPIVRRVGGLADTVVDETEDDPQRPANGFVFDRADALAGAVRRAVEAHRDSPRWRRLVSAGMRAGLGWQAPARRYLDEYRSVSH
ncbi:MAG: glycogen synthase GlgA [Burkholderiaceae bacterium]